MPRNTPFPNIVLQSDATLNDSDKTLTVPAGKLWHVRHIYASLVSTATPGNRQLDVLITDASDNPISKAVAGAVQAQSLGREYIFAPHNPQETAFTNGLMYRHLPDPIFLPAGYKVRIYDSAAIAAAADDLIILVLVEEMVE